MEKLSLSGLLGLVEMALAENFFDQTFYITAETTDIRNYRERNYCFLKLIEKDESGIVATADAVIWRQAYPQIFDFEKKTGIKFDKSLEVLLEVSVEYSPKWGLRLNIHRIDASFTLGKLELQRKETLEKLVANNPQLIWERNGEYFSRNGQLPLPSPIRRIALITAPASDGQRDFKHEIASNPYGYCFLIDEYLSQVQGNGAEKVLVEQLNSILQSNRKYDLVVLVRGGGSQTDFGPFDSYDLGVALAAFPIPVITGIGHERNVSIADLLSNKAVKTPTKAASYIIEQNAQWESGLLEMHQQICQLSNQILDELTTRLSRKSYSVLHISQLLAERYQNRLTKTEQALNHLNPERVLERGYALVSKNGRIVKDSEDVAIAETIDIYMKDWEMQAEVKAIRD